jgi:hypothetical protein
MQSVSPGQVVNGGLIDFQDNFHRGVADPYANYMNGQQQHYMGTAVGSMAGFPGPMPFQSMQQHAFQGVAGGLPMAATTNLPCISGPPAYLHVNGQTYVPVDAQQPVSASKPAAPAETVAAAETSPRVLTEDEIERRVRHRVEEWAAGQRKPVYYTGAASSSSGSSRKGRGRETTDEDRAADRIKSVNASMRGRFVSPF